MPKVGVIAIQGDVEKHVAALRRCQGLDAQIAEVRTPEDLAQIDRVILPGGESTTVGLLMQRYGLGDALRAAAAEGMPMWGTCMGMILMAKTVAGRPEQYTLGLLDIEVQRNAFGSQIHSFEDEVGVAGIETPVKGIFIRAPVVTRLGPSVEPLASYGGQVVAVRQGRLLGTAFHPELTSDDRMHRFFLEL
jgi:pyridoxal 5'-phosphate synthase pdxT subunit